MCMLHRLASGAAIQAHVQTLLSRCKTPKEQTPRPKTKP